MRHYVVLGVVAIVCVLAVLAVMNVGSSSKGYKVLEYSSKNGNLYCTFISSSGKSAELMVIHVEKPVEIVLANPVQLFENVRISACDRNGKCVSSINMIVLRNGTYTIKISSQFPGTYCFKIVSLG